MPSEVTTFWKYLEAHELKIPIIQRDYAQGRDDKSELRNRFLKSLRGAFSSAPENSPSNLLSFFSRLKKNYKKQVSSKRRGVVNFTYSTKLPFGRFNRKRYGIRKKSPLKKNITLDFIYGVNSGNVIQPLDGQQRLTTLWLLHWYIAAKAGKTGKNTHVSNVLKKFSYETRCSSRDFCEKLSEFQPDFSHPENIAVQIKNQTWFNSNWIQDPTISGMLRMLSGDEQHISKDNIEAVVGWLENSEFYWNQLTAEAEKCPIRFYAFDMGVHGLTDDLYLKMNARGEQLTAFENFKADLINWVCQHQTSKASIELAGKIDNAWTDIFWEKRLQLPKAEDRIPFPFEKKWANRIDEIFFAFINRFWFNYMIASGDFSSTAYGEMSFYDDELKYASFDDQYISQHGITLTPAKVAQALTALSNTLDNYVKVKDKSIIKDFLIPPWKDDEDSKDNSNQYGKQFIPEYYVNGGDAQPVKPLSLKGRAVFFAACQFIEKLPDGIADNVIDKLLKDWHRVVWNIVENASFDISSIGSMLRLLKLMSSKCFSGNGILEFLGNHQVNENDFASDQVREECWKAKKIFEDQKTASEWETKIRKAENYAFFRGAIRFLFTDAGGNVDWTDFDFKLENSKKYFGDNGVNESFKIPLTKALVLTCSQWGSQLYDKQVVNTSASCWKHILCSNDWREPIHIILSSKTLPDKRTDDIDEVNARKYVQPILPLFPYEWIVENWPEGRIKWNRDRLGFYPRKVHEAIVLDWGDFRRNYFLSNSLGNVTVASSNKIEGTNNFFMGWDVTFSYRDPNTHGDFQWTTTNIVYLLSKDLHRIRRNAYREGQDDINNFYCFPVKPGWDADTLKSELVKLVVEQSKQSNAQQS